MSEMKKIMDNEVYYQNQRGHKWVEPKVEGGNRLIDLNQGCDRTGNG